MERLRLLNVVANLIGRLSALGEEHLKSFTPFLASREMYEAKRILL